jgi:hypothetical protein
MTMPDIQSLLENSSESHETQARRRPVEKGESKVRLIKMFGLAALAAVAAMAFVGASSAMANEETALCDEHTSLTCGAGHVVTGHIEAKATHALLKTSFGNVLCTGSHLLANALGLAKPQVSHVELFSFTGCKELTFNTGCTVTTVKLGLLLLLKTALNLGTLESHDNEVLVSCTSIGLHCIYGGLPVVHAEGTTATTMLPKITATEAVLTSTGGGFCPASSKWTATYSITLPDLLYILN